MWCCGRLNVVSGGLDVELKLNEFPGVESRKSVSPMLTRYRPPIQLRTAEYMNNDRKKID